MRHVSQWFSTIPEDEDGSRRWYQRNREWYGGPGEGPESRWRLVVGDLLEVNENENGDFAGAQFGVDLRMGEDVGQFDYDDTDRWHDHSITVVFWRWGVYFAWRGGLKAGR